MALSGGQADDVQEPRIGARHEGHPMHQSIREHSASRSREDQLAALATFAADLAGEFQLGPLLERILINAVQLLGCRSGSICTIDEAANLYRKEIDLGVGCRSGELFPLDEGVTGAVVRARGVVFFDDYSAVPGGHISPGDMRFSRAVIGVPIRFKSTLIGAFVVFGGEDDRTFDARDAELLELFAIHAAVAIMNSRLQAATGGDVDRRAIGESDGNPEAGPRELGDWTQDALTPREREVRALVERGWQDKQIASTLGISFKTVEKHVGTILRKTGARNRTQLASFASDRAG
jgi:DNA-binding CsgD family transcriptional regulator